MRHSDLINAVQSMRSASDLVVELAGTDEDADNEIREISKAMHLLTIRLERVAGIVFNPIESM